MSGAEDRPLPWAYAEQFTLGGTAEGPESFYSLGRGRVLTDGRGRIHVLDVDQFRVVTFDGDGRVVRTLGREGGGPGELKLPAALGAGPADDISVFDYGKGALVRWDSSGDVLPELAFPHRPTKAGLHHALTETGFLVSTYGPPDRLPFHRLIGVAGEDTLLMAEAYQPRDDVNDVERCGIGMYLTPLFTPSIVWDHRGDVTAVAGGTDYRIDLWRNGRLTRSVRRPFEPAPATREAAIAEVGEGFTTTTPRGPCTVPAGEFVDTRGWAAVVPAIQNVLLAPDGGLWVERRVPGQDPGPIDVFDADGAYVGTLPPGLSFPVLLLDHGRTATIAVDEMDIARLVVRAPL